MGRRLPQNGAVEQRIAVARLGDGTEVVYALAGTGPFLVCVPGWVSHLELSWAMPAERGFYEALARGRTLLRYDKPGTGLSGPLPRPPGLDLDLETLAAVTVAAGADRFDLVGSSVGAPVAVAWTAARPTTVDRLVLYGGWVRGHDIASPHVREHVLALVAAHWGLGSDVLADIFMPGADAGTRAAFVRYQRESAPAEVAHAMLAACYEVDIADALHRVRAPTLVLHREQDRAVPVVQGRMLAEGIPGAQLAVLPGQAHIPYVGDVDTIARLTRRFLGLPAPRRRAAPTLTPRQYEVAALVAEGFTNREIAERLHITERSAESHVERIRTRLGFRSRSQIAAWLVAKGGAAPKVP
jgi:pimeloyl-ACP methyl ester carboxylesterase/DNA-binding CsgD family transcriptional regulator